MGKREKPPKKPPPKRNKLKYSKEGRAAIAKHNLLKFGKAGSKAAAVDHKGSSGFTRVAATAAAAAAMSHTYQKKTAVRVIEKGNVGGGEHSTWLSSSSSTHDHASHTEHHHQQYQQKQQQSYMRQQQPQQYQQQWRGGGGRDPPPGWTDYEYCGTVVGQSPIIPMKVPLDPSRFMCDSHRIIPLRAIIREQQELYGRRIGMIVDLTATDKYYTAAAPVPTTAEKAATGKKIKKPKKSKKNKGPEGYVPNGVQYVKLSVEGQLKRVPDQLVDRFVSTIRSFRAEHPDQYVLVHCTHGINRTGFMVCSYLVQEHGLKASDAVELFARHRPPGMYSALTLSDLLIRFNDTDCALFHDLLAGKYPPIPAYALKKRDKLERVRRDVKAILQPFMSSRSSSSYKS